MSNYYLFHLISSCYHKKSSRRINRQRSPVVVRKLFPRTQTLLLVFFTLYKRLRNLLIMRLIVKQKDSDQSKPSQQTEPDAINADNRQVKQQIHLLPCKIRPRKSTKKSQTFTAPVDKYFRPYSVAGDVAEKPDSVNGDKLWHASLRGKPLNGVQLGMPEGYVGLFCKKTDETDQEGNVDLIADQSNSKTRQLMYWNWDRVPTREDPLLAALDWVHISEALMSNSD